MPQNAACKGICPTTCLCAPQCACLPQTVSACPETVRHGSPSSSAASHKRREQRLQQRVITSIISQSDSGFASQPKRSRIAAASQKKLSTRDNTSLAGQSAPDCSRRAWLARLLQTCALRDSCLRKQTQRKTAIMVPQETLPPSYGAISASISNSFEVPC